MRRSFRTQRLQQPESGLPNAFCPQPDVPRAPSPRNPMDQGDERKPPLCSDNLPCGTAVAFWYVKQGEDPSRMMGRVLLGLLPRGVRTRMDDSTLQ